MTDIEACELLGLATDATDEAIRARYLALVKECPPDRDPARFGEVRRAYDALRDSEDRLRRRVLLLDPGESPAAIGEELARRAGRRRLTLQQLVELAKP